MWKMSLPWVTDEPVYYKYKCFWVPSNFIVGVFLKFGSKCLCCLQVAKNTSNPFVVYDFPKIAYSLVHTKILQYFFFPLQFLPLCSLLKLTE